MRELCSVAFNLSESNAEEGTFRGYGCVFNTPIRTWCPTVMEPGAFSKTLQEQGGRVKILWQHNEDEPIGLPTSLTETAIGLELAGRISKTTRGLDAMTLVKDGVVTDLSIGFDAIKWDMEEREGQEPLRRLREVRLWEVSFVTWGANEPAKITEMNRLAGEAAGRVIADETIFARFVEKLNSADPEEAFRLACGPALFFARRPDAAHEKQLVEATIEALRGLIQQAAEPTPARASLTAKRAEQLRDAQIALAKLDNRIAA